MTAQPVHFHGPGDDRRSGGCGLRAAGSQVGEHSKIDS
ncbi:hypothetical protein OV450_6782 [Actinobacteria bacterium OV450]|nr:hypothetical protein OV450_6782 [Actinobacteria bacterium OV450]